MRSNIEFQRNMNKKFFNLNVKLNGEILSSGDFLGDSIREGFFWGILSAGNFS